MELYNRFIAGYCVDWSAPGIEQSKWLSSYRKYIKKEKKKKEKEKTHNPLSKSHQGQALNTS